MGKDQKILVYPGWKDSNYYKLLYQNSPSVEYASYDGAFFTLFRNYKIHQPNLIHLHWLTAYFAVDVTWSLNFIFRFIISFFDLFMLKIFTNVKIAWTVHNLYEHETKHEKSEIFVKKIVSKIVDKIIVLGPSAKSLVENVYKANPNKIVVSYHGHFNAVFPKNKLDKNQSRAYLKLPQEKKMYLFLGSAKEYKGIKELIKTFKKWGKQETVLVVAGKVSEELIKSMGELPLNITIHNGFVSNKDLPIYFKATDWTVIPYKRILTSATLLTAMGMGSAIITPSIGTLVDYLDKNGGILYNQNQNDSLLLSFEKSLILNSEVLGNYNKNKVLEFDWHKISSDTFKILNNL
jgi:glycosyltransferase involved in cell wall biosynthesis